MVTSRESRREGGKQVVDRLVCAFDDERAVANAGLVLVSTLAGRLGIEQVVDETLDLGGRPGAARPGRKLLTLVCSALVGGDSIDDADVCTPTPRHRTHDDTDPAPNDRQQRRHTPCQSRKVSRCQLGSSK